MTVLTFIHVSMHTEDQSLNPPEPAPRMQEGKHYFYNFNYSTCTCMEISAEKTPVSHGSLFSMGSVMHGCYGSPVIQSVLEGYYLRLFTICHAFCVFVLAGVLFILQRASVFFCYSNCDCEDTNPISFSRDNSS